jgi:hypothetical protein
MTQEYDHPPDCDCELCLDFIENMPYEEYYETDEYFPEDARR